MLKYLRELLNQKPRLWRIVGFILVGGVLTVGVGVSIRKTSAPSLNWPTDNVLTLNLGKEPPTLDPLRNTDSTSGRVIHELMRGLTDFNAQAKITPELAKSWTVSPDGKRYTFQLRSNIRWSDGKPITAGDFIYAWKRVLTQANGSAYAFFLFPILNAQAYYEGRLHDFSKVGIHSPNPHTLVITLSEANVFFPAMLAFPVAVPLRQDNVEKDGTQFTEAGRYLTNGPFQLKKWEHDSRLILTPNPYYWDHQARVRPTLQFEMIPDQNTALTLFEQGVLDMADSGTVISNFEYARYAQDPRAKEVGISFIQYLGFNTERAPFDSPDLRRAFCQCIQREDFPILLKSGETPIKSFVTPNLFGANPKLGHDFNPSAANATWQNYLQTHPDFKMPLLSFTNDYGVRKIAEIIKFHAQESFGMSPPLQTLDWKVYLSRLTYDTPPFFLLTWFVDYPDADSFLGLFHSSNGNNHTGWTSKRYDTLIEAARRLPNTPARQALYNEAQTLLLNQDTVICPLFTRRKLWLNHAWVEGLSFNSMNDLVLENVRLKKQASSSTPSTEKP
jgi:ABC-type oligopeptide transport system substrate-binding subunit